MSALQGDPKPRMAKWTPTTDPLTLRRMGKLGEELGEAQTVAARVIIQGIDEVDPGSGKVNRQRLMDELADVQAQIGCTVLAFDLDQHYMGRRTAEKMRQMAEWEAMFSAPAEPSPAVSNSHVPLATDAAKIERRVEDLVRRIDAMPPLDEFTQQAAEVQAALQEVEDFLRALIEVLGLQPNSDSEAILAAVRDLKQPEAAGQAWLSIETAPKDGTCVLLLVADGEHPLQDEDPSVTIGSYGVEGGPAEDPTWHFPGWSWHQDCYCRGIGNPIGWLPLPPAASQPADEGGAA